jgi:hypothetical protein
MKNKGSEVKIERVERHLQSSLRPITPRTEFVNNLRQRLIDHDHGGLEIWEPQDSKSLWVLLGLFSGLALALVFLYLRWRDEKGNLARATA